MSASPVDWSGLRGTLEGRAAGRSQRLGPVWQPQRRGRVVEAMGITLRIAGLPLRIGELCTLSPDDGAGEPLRGEVIGVQGSQAVLMPFGGLEGVRVGARVQACGLTQNVPVGAGLLGRVVDAFGQPLDGRPLPPPARLAPLKRAPPPAMQRQPIDAVLATGIACVDALATVGRGQRVGVFAPAGVGKTTLLGMLARHAQAEVIVIALIGERGRELREFLDEVLDAPARARCVVVVSTSDAPAMARAKAAQYATAVAEYFRDVEQRDTLLIMDSLTRYARALREIGLAGGEPPARRGYPPSVFAELPRLLERAGNSDRGTLTAFYTVLMEDEDSADPIAEEVRSILDGHLILARKLAAAGRYPAIDPLASLSRVMSQLVSREHRHAAEALRALIAKYDEVSLLVQVGEYRSGSDPQADRAIARHAAIEQFLKQDLGDHLAWHQTCDRLRRLAGA